MNYSLLFFLHFLSFSLTAQIKTGYDALTAMHNAYTGNKWYKNFTFSQETKFYKDGKCEKTEIWHEASSSPGKLLIKFGTKDSKNGVIFENNAVHSFRENEKPVHKPMVHDLLLAAFDVYFLKPSETFHLLDSLGYNLKLVREDVFNGRKVLIVGAAKNDSLSNQIWIDAERFYLHRLIYRQGKTVRNVILTDYIQMPIPSKKEGQYWVATKIIFNSNGQLSMEEKYFDIKFPEELNKDLFDPEKFNETKLD